MSRAPSRRDDRGGSPDGWWAFALLMDVVATQAFLLPRTLYRLWQEYRHRQ